MQTVQQANAEPAKASKPPKFYIVFSPDGPTPPVKMHPTHKSAAHAAWEMANRHPGQNFFIMERAGKPAHVAAEALAEAA